MVNMTLESQCTIYEPLIRLATNVGTDDILPLLVTSCLPIHAT